MNKCVSGSVGDLMSGISLMVAVKANLPENLNKDGSINWDFVGADINIMYSKNERVDADMIEGVMSVVASKLEI